jgi:(E)-4-hydroxy-3-methylbut-2-enyl-diphosphate synthase
MSWKYNYSPFFYGRFPTREVKVGSIGIGGQNPIRIQSMTTSDTCDTEETVRQILELERVGCEIVRLTVPSQADADNLPNIRARLKQENSKVPLVADIHFTPSVAMKVVEYVEKVRVNPGNFADKKKFQVKEYTNSEYQEEIDRIAEVFSPLVKRCKELGVAMRIGTNHGSLSDRIMNRYGDTPLGMVESALEFIRIAESFSFYDIVVSMKASNPQVMVQAYRLLVNKFIESNRNYPLHLGVTEAGNGKDGRIKSAMGIGSLLADGLGDTIRVSLTEDSIHEIPAARRIASSYQNLSQQSITSAEFSEFRDPFQYSRFYSSPVPVGDLRIGENYPVRVETLYLGDYSDSSIQEYSAIKQEEIKIEILHFTPKSISELGKIAKWKRDQKLGVPISISLENLDVLEIISLPEQLDFSNKIVLQAEKQFLENPEFSDFLKSVFQKQKSIELQFTPETISWVPEFVNYLSTWKEKSILFSLHSVENFIFDYRKLAFYLKDSDFPILLDGFYPTSEDVLFDASAQMGSLLLDGIGDCIRIRTKSTNSVEVLTTSFDILQAARLRTIKTEYISCPSCGRTLFNLQDTTARIKSKTSHLKGVKIAIMGCIVNGPGEMADADFGYVGAGPGKVHLYYGKEIVAKSIPDTIADERLVELIKEKGKWVDPQ